MLKNISLFLSLALSSILFSGCSSVINSYPAQIEPVKAKVAKNDFNAAIGTIAKKTKGNDACLYLQEVGRIASFEQDIEKSTKYYAKAANIIDQAWGKPIFSVSDAAYNAGAVLSNDNAIPYAPDGYEKVLIHTFQMLNYLSNDDLEGAAVEARKAGNDQKFIEERFHKEIETAKKDADKKKLDLQKNAISLPKVSPAMDLAASKVKNSFQNAFTFYLSGVIWECMNDSDNAYVAYQKALEVFPENEFVKNDVFRLASELNRKEDLGNLEKVFGTQTPNKAQEDEGRLVVIYEEGYVPEKEQFKFPILFSSRTYTVALPFYRNEWKVPHSLVIKSDNKSLGNTEVICSTYALAAKALQEAYPGIIVRQALRLAAKDELQKQTQKVSSVLGAAISISSLVLERADRRSWLTLPNNFQVGSFYLPKGSHSIEVSPLYGENKPISVSIAPNKTTFLRVIDTGSQSIVSHTKPI